MKLPERVQKTIDEAKERVSVACDEYHAHTADCLHGDPRDVAICFLKDWIKILEGNIEDLHKKVEKGWQRW